MSFRGLKLKTFLISFVIDIKTLTKNEEFSLDNLQENYNIVFKRLNIVCFYKWRFFSLPRGLALFRVLVEK